MLLLSSTMPQIWWIQSNKNTKVKGKTGWGNGDKKSERASHTTAIVTIQLWMGYTYGNLNDKKRYISLNNKKVLLVGGKNGLVCEIKSNQRWLILFLLKNYTAFGEALLKRLVYTIHIYLPEIFAAAGCCCCVCRCAQPPPFEVLPSENSCKAF